jgi:hypothetical protein
MLIFTPDASTESNSKLLQITLPSDGRFVDISYGSLYIYMLEKHNCICLGLYRRGHDGRGFQYLMLNPPAEVKIKEEDSLYLIGPKLPSWEELVPTPLD